MSAVALCETDLDFVAANELEVVDGRLTGALRGVRVVDGAGKADALQRGADRIGVPLAQTVAVGSGDDIEVLERAGLGIAVARPLTAASPYGELPYGDNVLLVLGLTPDEIAASGSAQ